MKVIGRLVYNDFGEYEIHNEYYRNTFCLSKFLDAVYYSDKSNYLSFKIYKNGGKTLYNEKGNLYRRKEEDSEMYTYCQNGSELDKILFYNTNEIVDVEIDCRLGGNVYGKYIRKNT